MMKKFTKATLLLAAAALLLAGLPACSDDDDGGVWIPETKPVTGVSVSPDHVSVEEGKTATLTATVEPEGATDKNLTWSAEPEERAKLTENEDGTVTVTGKTAGTVTITATASNNVKSNGLEIEVKAEEVTGTTYAWDFQAAGLTLNLPESGVFNKVDTAMSSSKATDITASTGAVEPDANSALTVTVRGPFTAVMLCGANADSDKGDRYAYIKVNDEEVCAPTKIDNKLFAKGQKISYTYEGDDEVTVAFGVSSGYVHIYDIQITTANDEATLGLVGTSADSSNPSVATAKIDDSKVKITSVSAGTATITVTDAQKATRRKSKSPWAAPKKSPSGKSRNT